MYRIFLFIIITAILCSAQINDKTFIIKEEYQTERVEELNVDSPAFWSNGKLNYLIATSKKGDKLLIYDAVDGSKIKEFGKSGSGKGEFKRPNGIWVIDSLMFIVERDNRRVQIFSLPSLSFKGFIEDNNLRKPYGLYVKKDKDDYTVYVTDNYETEQGTTPPDNELDKRIHIYKYGIKNDIPYFKLEKYFGETSGEGKLKVVESINGDTEYNNLLISEEDTTDSCVKIYTADGKYKNLTAGKGLFKFQVEGIALYKKGKGGFWIVTDQSMTKNRFLVFDRKTFSYLGAFEGPNTLNTDGIWLSDKKIGKYKKGLFFAVHNDGNVSAFDFEKILKAFGRR